MGESSLIWSFPEESALAARAGELAEAWARAGSGPLLIGLIGDLGSGKTTWVRAMLRGLGHRGRVPSPTYTLLEEYRVAGLRLVHLDLYRLQASEELEDLGLRDWLASDDVWLLVEWPERAPSLERACDLAIRFDITGPTARRVALEGLSAVGRNALEAAREGS